MANIFIKTDERRENETYVLRQFGKDSRTADSGDREYAECIAARMRETFERLKKEEK